MRIRMSAAAVVAGLLSGPAAAQNQIEWKQVVNIEKGANLPRDVKGDILGIELGETYAAVKPKMQALLAEGIPRNVPKETASTRMMGIDTGSPLREQRMTIRLQLPGGSPIEASYIGNIAVDREMKGVGPRAISENIKVHFSAPSSGHQVIAVERMIAYGEQGDQVRIAEVVKSLSDKFKSAPQVYFDTTHRWQFNNGNPFVSKRGDPYFACTGLITADEHEVARINERGECDVLLHVSFTHGISKEHARVISFTLTDYERAKANLTADFGFFENYVKSLQDKTSGRAPKL